MSYPCSIALAVVLVFWATPLLAQQVPLQPVTLEDLERHALENAPPIRRLVAARAQLNGWRLASAQRWTENPTVQVMAGPRFTPTGRGVDLQLSISQPLPVWGMLSAQRIAADAAAADLDAQQAVTALEVRADLRQAWAQALWSTRRAQLARLSALHAARIADTLAAQESAGESSKLSLRLAQTDAAQTAALRDQLEAEAAQHALKLVERAGWPLDKPLRMPEQLPTPEAVPPLDTLTPHNKQLARAAQHLKLARAKSELARRRARTAPSLGVQLQREGNPEGSEWVAFGTVSWSPPLLQREQVAIAEAEAEVAIAQEELLLATREAALLLRQRYALAVSTYAQWSTLQNALVPQFEEDLRQIERGWQLGELRLLEALEARKRLFELEEATVEAWGQHLVARAALNALTESTP